MRDGGRLRPTQQPQTDTEGGPARGPARDSDGGGCGQAQADTVGENRPCRLRAARGPARVPPRDG